MKADIQNYVDESVRTERFAIPQLRPLIASSEVQYFYVEGVAWAISSISFLGIVIL